MCVAEQPSRNVILVQLYVCVFICCCFYFEFLLIFLLLLLLFLYVVLVSLLVCLKTKINRPTTLPYDSNYIKMEAIHHHKLQTQMNIFCVRDYFHVLKHRNWSGDMPHLFIHFIFFLNRNCSRMVLLRRDTSNNFSAYLLLVASVIYCTIGTLFWLLMTFHSFHFCFKFWGFDGKRKLKCKL